MDSDLLEALEQNGASTEDSDFACKLFSGYHFTPHFAVEASYVDLGKYTANHDDSDLDLEVDGFGFALMAKLPIGPVSLFAKLGLLAWDAEMQHTGIDRRRNRTTDTYTDNGTAPLYGLGLEYRADRLLLRGEYERFALDTSDTELSFDLFTASIGYRF